LVEVLVAIGIIALLIAVTLPAIQMARESARATECRNNLRQLGVATMNHVSAQKHFPSGGWGSRWAGDPDRGFGRRQPGSWLYNILPYAEEQELHDLGKGKTRDEKHVIGKDRAATAVALFNCPTRRRPQAYPFSSQWNFFNIDQPDVTGRSDYAANAGDLICCVGDGPKTIEEGDMARLAPPKDSDWVIPQGVFTWPRADELATGIIYQRSMIRDEDVTDGLSHTYLVGEKYMRPSDYVDGQDPGDARGWIAGYSPDNQRWTGFQQGREPRQDSDAESTSEAFGSPHPHAMNFVFTDGSVHAISYSIDPKVHSNLGNRGDGEVTDYSQVP
jgi:prepilin-type processing-associated H-X9-DG protein